MGRLKELRKYVDNELEQMPDAGKRTGAIAHLYGVSLAATMLAKKRGLDPELASMSAMRIKAAAMRTMPMEVRSWPEKFSEPWD